MGQVLGVVLVASRVRRKTAVEDPKMAFRRRGGMALWLNGSASIPEADVSVSSVYRDPARQFLSRYGGRLPGGGRSDSPLSPHVRVSDQSPLNQPGSGMATEAGYRLNALSRDLEGPARRSTSSNAREGFWS